jgi:hypothetical protein
MPCLGRPDAAIVRRPWAAAAAKVGGQDMARNMQWFNLPNMLTGPSNFFGPEGPADRTGLARDFRYQRHLTAISRLHPVSPAWLIFHAGPSSHTTHVPLQPALFAHHQRRKSWRRPPASRLS